MLGYLEALAAAALWGSSGIFSVALFERGLTPPDVALLRPWAGAAFLVVGALLLRPRVFRIGRSGLLWTAGVGGVATALFQVAYQSSTQAVGVPTTVALLYLAPGMVLAASGPLLDERPTPRQVVSALVSVAGVWMTVAGATGVRLGITASGVAWGVLAAASYASYTLLGRYAAPRWGSFATVVHSTLGAVVLLSLAVPALWGAPAPGAIGAAWELLAAYGLLTIAVAAFLFYDALGRITAGRAAVAATAEPVVAALLAAWLVDQGLTPVGWAGLVLVVAGVAGASMPARRRRPPASGSRVRRPEAPGPPRHPPRRGS